MDSATKVITFVVSVLIILTVMVKCSIGAEGLAVQEDMSTPGPLHKGAGSFPSERSWPRSAGKPEIPTRPRPRSSQSVPSRLVLEEDLDVYDASSTGGPYETWTGPDAPVGVVDPQVPQEKFANFSALQNCSAWDFSNVDLLILLTSCPPLVSGISADCCTELVNIERDLSECFCTFIQTLFGTSLDTIVELPTLLANCTELSNPCP